MNATPPLDSEQKNNDSEKKLFFLKKTFWKKLWNNVGDILILILVLLFIRGFILSPFQISGKSMEYSLHNKELILTNRLAFGDFFGIDMGDPKRGDVVVFRPPHDRSTFYIKRVIAVPGETIAFRGKKVLVNGVEIKEPYINCARFEDNRELDNWCNYDNVNQREPWTVPENTYFLMGDNRNNSTDSRSCFSSCQTGISPFVPEEDIVGKAWVVLWPLFGTEGAPGPSGLRFAPNFSYDQL